MMLNFLKRLSPIVFLVLAIVFYTVGFRSGAIALIVLGIAAEIGFWVGIFKLNKPSPEDT